jgi:hypothetical protein
LSLLKNISIFKQTLMGKDRDGFESPTTLAPNTLPVMHPEISVDNYSVDNNAFFQNILGHFRTGFHRNSLGNLKRFLVFYFPPLFVGLKNPFLLSLI